jgi:hypothetical protein
LLIIGDDFIADINALVTYVNFGSRYQFLDFILRLSTERTTERSVPRVGKDLVYGGRRFRGLVRDNALAVLPFLWHGHNEQLSLPRF